MPAVTASRMACRSDVAVCRVSGQKLGQKLRELVGMQSRPKPPQLTRRFQPAPRQSRGTAPPARRPLQSLSSWVPSTGGTNQVPIDTSAKCCW